MKAFLLLSLVVVALANPVAEKAEKKRGLLGGGIVNSFLGGVEGAVNSLAHGAESMVADAGLGIIGGGAVKEAQQSFVPQQQAQAYYVQGGVVPAGAGAGQAYYVQGKK